MAINYQYPRLGALASDDLIIVADISDDNATKTVTAQQIANLGSGGGGSGDVVGPASSVDLSIPVFDGTTGKLLKDATGVTIDTDGNVTLNNWPETEAEFRGDLDGAVKFTAQANENISFGEVVYISGASGDNTLVEKAQSDSASTAPSFGFAFSTATSGNPIQIVSFGNLYGSGTKPLDTTVDSDGNSITIGDTLYLSPTTAGGFTNVRPTDPAELVQNIGKVTRVHATNGSIKVGGAGRVNSSPNTIDITGDITSDGDVEGATITKTGGTSSQFLKADGTVDSSTYITELVQDTSPELGGNLDLGATPFSIISQSGSNANINITPDGIGAVVLDGLTYPTVDGNPGEILTTNGSGTLSFTAAGLGTVTSVSGAGTAGGLTLTGTVTSSGSLTLGGSLDISTDTTPQLGGTLDANTNDVTGAGKFQGDQFQSILNGLAASAAVTFNTSNGVYAELTIDQNCTLDITNLGAGTPAVLKVTQDATTPFTISSYTVSGGPAVVKWPGGVVPTITTTLSAIDIITFISDGTNIYGSIVQDLS
jgi:hypothetical protein